MPIEIADEKIARLAAELAEETLAHHEAKNEIARVRAQLAETEAAHAKASTAWSTTLEENARLKKLAGDACSWLQISRHTLSALSDFLRAYGHQSEWTNHEGATTLVEIDKVLERARRDLLKGNQQGGPAPLTPAGPTLAAELDDDPEQHREVQLTPAGRTYLERGE